MIAVEVSMLKVYLELHKLRSRGQDICLHLEALLLLLFFSFCFIVEYH